MRIPRGITGFHAFTETPPTIEAKSFKSIAYEFAIALDGQVVRTDSRILAPKSFYRAEIVCGKLRFQLLQNYIHVHVSLVEDTDLLPLVFIDSPYIAASLPSHVEHQLLDYAILESRPQDHDLSDLSNAEMEQVEYWKPARLGDLIFNHWD